VQVAGKPVFSCVMPVSAVEGKPVRTIEGLGTPGHLSPLQQAFVDHQAAQCGYCIAGMIMRAQALLDTRPESTETEIRDYMQPNLCRCGTHMRIIGAIVQAFGTAAKQRASNTDTQGAHA
jgi:aerobic-type carbon monoxide dehydrogenase small subunit (CoxS/CutS family)